MILHDNDICIRAEVQFHGKTLHLNRLIMQFDLEDLLPARGPFIDPYDMVNVQQRAERRQRAVDLIAAQFAQALLEGIYKAVR